jgi:hypothetical protein
MNVDSEDIANGTGVVRSYVLTRPRTVNNFELLAGTWESVSSELIRSTRIFSSRISRVEEDCFIERAQGAPWHNLESGDLLVDADPACADGLYDRGLEIWNHFEIDGRPGIGTAKISKVLDAMRPHFFPVLDSRLLKAFRKDARIAALDLRFERTGDHLYWAAIRRDLFLKDRYLTGVRNRMKSDESDSVRRWVTHVSDVRLYDVLCWSA